MTQDQPKTPEPNQPQEPSSTDAQARPIPSEAVNEVETSENSTELFTSSDEAQWDDTSPAAPPPPAAVASTAPSPDLPKQGKPTAPPTATRTSAAAPPSKLQTFFRLVGQLWSIVLAIVPVLVSGVRRLAELGLKLLRWVWTFWQALLPRLRPLLPAQLNQLPDWGLTTLALSLLAVVLWITTLILPGSSPTIATSPEPVPPELVAPAPVPDADRIAKIQTQVAQATDQYAEGLIEAVQANFSGNRLIVEVGDRWYSLDANNQDRVANEMLKRSRQLKFDKLEITNSEGTLVGRSPVVGSGVVLYQRERETI